MSTAKLISDFASSETGKLIIPGIVGALLGWIGSSVAAWWKSRDRYQAHVTWQTVDTIYGEETLPVVLIQSVHTLPINVTRISIHNRFGRLIDDWALYAEGPEDYPEFPSRVEPLKSRRFVLDQKTLAKAAKQISLLNWLPLSRVYVAVETMGRGRRLFVAEGGLSWELRRKRYRR